MNTASIVNALIGVWKGATLRMSLVVCDLWAGRDIHKPTLSLEVLEKLTLLNRLYLESL
jgi:hypothetical protein